MSTTINILEYLWGSPQLQAAFMDFAEKKGEPMPTLHEMFVNLTKGMDSVHRDWYTVIADEQGPQFRMVMHTAADWHREIDAMNQDIANRISKRLLNDVQPDR